LTTAGWAERFAAAAVDFPRWSPEAPQRLFFGSDESGTRQVWAYDTTTGARTRLTDQALGVESLAVLPDGSGIAWWCDDTGDGRGAWLVSTTGEPLVDADGGWAEGISLATDPARGLVVALAYSGDHGQRVLVSVGDGVPRQLLGPGTPAGLGRVWANDSRGGLSADGRLLGVRVGSDVLHLGLRVLDVATGATVADLGDPGLALTVADWSPVPGDDRLAFVHERDGIERPAVLTVGPDGSTVRRDFPVELPGPVDVAGWWPDGSALLLVHQHRGRGTLHRLDVASGAVSEVHDPQGHVSGAGVRPDGSVWLREESAARAPRVRTVAGDEVLTAPGPSMAPGRPHESLVFAGPAGPTHAMLTRPTGAPPYPLVALVHGGPEWAEPDDLDPWLQALVDTGYAVVRVDYRGSTGSTVAWRTALHGGNIGLPEVEDVVAAVDHLVAEGIADPARLAVEGWSWGGYVAALAIGRHPATFAAAIAGVPVCDLVLCHEDCSPAQQAYDVAVMGGTPEQLPAQYAARSPVSYVDRVRTPVLLIAGEHDSACPIRQVRHYADQLRSRGGVVELFEYPGGHHTNALAERLHQARLRLAFLARHVPVP
jgi:dipeptidyl aminopeptidase/acylaminoacyl peptidase